MRHLAFCPCRMHPLRTYEDGCPRVQSVGHSLWRFGPPVHSRSHPTYPMHGPATMTRSKIFLLLIVDVVIAGRQTCVLWQAFTVSRRWCVYNAGFGRTLLTLFYIVQWLFRNVLAVLINWSWVIGIDILFLTITDCSWRQWLVVKKCIFVNKRVALL